MDLVKKNWLLDSERSEEYNKDSTMFFSVYTIAWRINASI